MKKALVILCLVAVLAVVAGCSQPSPAQPFATPAPVPVTTRAPTATHLPTTTVPAPATPSSVSDNTITISKMTFNPSQITVKTGADVRWVNADSVIHRIKFLDDTKSPLLSVGQSYTRSFDTPGVYYYSCLIHPSMQGTVTVE
jgi:plastocyanin